MTNKQRVADAMALANVPDRFDQLDAGLTAIADAFQEDGERPIPKDLTDAYRLLNQARHCFVLFSHSEKSNG